ncbi:MAG TPA: TIGR03086 family metal-binding protein [Pseudonocardiaceae bacterium]|nr:TIGR03086 family metal-binding protein [Pseudonocardiaceae bacterium]
MDNIQELDRRAVEVSRGLVRNVTTAQLGLPTPCAEWDLGALLAHMTVQHHGFARAVAGERTELADWQPGAVDTAVAEDAASVYSSAVDHVLDAFGAPGALSGRAYLPEIRGGITVPAGMAMGFHFVDYVVHGWDVAAALRLPVEFDDEVLAAALEVAGQVPDDDASRGPGTAFHRGLAAPDDAAVLDRVLAMLGRSPNWPSQPPTA